MKSIDCFLELIVYSGWLLRPHSTIFALVHEAVRLLVCAARWQKVVPCLAILKTCFCWQQRISFCLHISKNIATAAPISVQLLLKLQKAVTVKAH